MSLRRPWVPRIGAGSDAAAADAQREREDGRQLMRASAAASPAVRRLRLQIVAALAVPGWDEDTLRTIAALIGADEHAPGAAKGALAALAEALRA